jgi:hypothetical protein
MERSGDRPAWRGTVSDMSASPTASAALRSSARRAPMLRPAASGSWPPPVHWWGDRHASMVESRPAAGARRSVVTSPTRQALEQALEEPNSEVAPAHLVDVDGNLSELRSPPAPGARDRRRRARVRAHRAPTAPGRSAHPRHRRDHPAAHRRRSTLRRERTAPSGRARREPDRGRHGDGHPAPRACAISRRSAGPGPADRPRIASPRRHRGG